MSMSTVVQHIANGRDLDESLPALRADPKGAVAALLAGLAGFVDLEVSEDIDPRDAYDHLLSALAVLGRDEVDHLIVLLHDALDANSTAHAFPLAWVLAHTGPPRAAEPLMAAVASRAATVRWAACIGLRRLRVRRARALLNKAAADRDSLVRGEAVEALAQLGDRSSLAVLRKRLRDRYPGIRVAARRAIERINARG